MSELQATLVLATLADAGLGSIVEACDSAVPFIVGSLRDWADKGAQPCNVQRPATRCITAVEAGQCETCLPDDIYMSGDAYNSQTKHMGSQPEIVLGADNPWEGSRSASQHMESLYAMVANLGRISARFVARLVHAGALTALERLRSKAAGHGARLGAHEKAMEEARTLCFTTFARSVPQVTCWGCCCEECLS